MAELKKGTKPVSTLEGFILRKHGASSVIEGLKNELKAVRAREDLADNDAAQRYEFVIETAIILAETLREANEALTERIEKLEADTREAVASTRRYG